MLFPEGGRTVFVQFAAVAQSFEVPPIQTPFICVSLSACELFAELRSVPFVPSSATDAVSDNSSAFRGGTGGVIPFETLTANVAEPLVLKFNAPMVRLHTVPAGLPLAQLQPAVLPVVVNVVLVGTV